MSNLATHYLIKAKDAYPYELAEAMEALEYSLSYGDTNAAAHCLMGRMQLDQLKNYKEAFYHFEKALVADIDHFETYYYYADALINYGDFERVKKLLSYAQQIPGICQACILQRKSMIHEKNGDLIKAKKQLKKALQLSTNGNERYNLKEDLKRVQEKMKE